MANNTPYKRVDRMADALRIIVSEVISTEVHHSGIGGVTVTEVKVTPDLKYAKVYYRVLDLEDKATVFSALQKVQRNIQKKVAAHLHTKYVPKLSFEYDESFDEGSHINQLLKSVNASALLEDSEEE